MTPSLSLKEMQTRFIERSTIRHDGIYDYSQVQYTKEAAKVKIICPIHGLFEQIAHNHQLGAGCLRCHREKAPVYDTKTFIDVSTPKHQGLYDYSLVDWQSSKIKVKIKCPTHGIFLQYPLNHLLGHGCRQCVVDKTRLTTETFINRAKQIHPNYDYSLTEYGQNDREKVSIICPKPGHGVFKQTPNSHLSGSGCSNCNESHLERNCARILTEMNILFDREYKIKCKDIEDPNHIRTLSIDFRFMINNQECFLEQDGEQHFSERRPGCKFKYTLHEVIQYDRSKNMHCKDHHIHLLRISYKEMKTMSQYIKSFIEQIPSSTQTVFMCSNPSLYNDQRAASESSTSNKRRKLNSNK